MTSHPSKIFLEAPNSPQVKKWSLFFHLLYYQNQIQLKIVNPKSVPNMDWYTIRSTKLTKIFKIGLKSSMNIEQNIPDIKRYRNYDPKTLRSFRRCGSRYCKYQRKRQKRKRIKSTSIQMKTLNDTKVEGTNPQGSNESVKPVLKNDLLWYRGKNAVYHNTEKRSYVAKMFSTLVSTE